MPTPLKIAVVDDDQIYQFIMQRTFDRISPESKILNFSNCGDFYLFLKHNSSDPTLIPDLVLLDLNTPFMNGWEFLDAFKELEKSLAKIPEIYLVTSSVDPNDLEMAKGPELLTGFFVKPLKPEQVLEVIHKIAVKLE